MFDQYVTTRQNYRQLGLALKQFNILELVSFHHRSRRLCNERRSHTLHQKMVDSLIDDLIEKGYLVEVTESDILEMKSYVEESRCPDMPSGGYPDVGDLDLTLLGKEVFYQCVGCVRQEELSISTVLEQGNGDIVIIGTDQDAVLRNFHAQLTSEVQEIAAIEYFSDIRRTDEKWRDRWWRMFHGGSMMTLRCNPDTSRTVEDVFIRDEATDTIWRRI